MTEPSTGSDRMRGCNARDELALISELFSSIFFFLFLEHSVPKNKFCAEVLVLERRTAWMDIYDYTETLPLINCDTKTLIKKRKPMRDHVKFMSESLPSGLRRAVFAIRF